VSKLTRRAFIHTSVGAASGLAAAGALGAAPHLAGAIVRPSRGTPLAEGAPQPMVAYVRDASRGEIALMVGDREVSYHDSEVVGRLIKAAQ
jgi:hypothetical protein